MKLHRKIAGLFGYELIKRRKLNDTLEQHLGNLLSVLDVNCVVDVGANTGQFGRILRGIGFNGRIVSFEPLQSAYTELRERSAEDKKWHAKNFALGRTAGQATVQQYQSSDFSSLLQPNEFARQRFHWRVEAAGEEETQVRTLDACWPEITNGLGRPRVFVKLDTQGFDLEVLAGASAVLAHVAGLQSEVSLKPIYEGMPGHIEALTEFQRLGFEITGLYPVSRDKPTLALIEMDCLMRRATS